MRTTWGRRFAAVLATVGIATGTAAASAAPAPLDSVAADPAAVQQALDSLRTTAGSPGAGVTYTNAQGTQSLSSGTGRWGATQPIQGNHRMRVGSISKTFTAALVLQLVDQQRVGLDTPIDTYLPGRVRFASQGADRDGRTITVRQLLQHTSGIANPRMGTTAKAQIDDALAQGSQSQPGTTFLYSNANFDLVASIVEAVTGTPYATALRDRIATPLGLGDTYSPAPGDTSVQGEYVRGYQNWFFFYWDVTAQDIQWATGAGSVVSSQADVNRFFAALLAGQVVSPGLVQQMRTVVPVDGGWFTGYGLALQRFQLSCGTAWGHNGAVAGYVVTTVRLDDGRQATASVNSWPALSAPGAPILDAQAKVFNAALC